MEFGIVYTVTIGTEKRHILEATVSGAPDDTKPAAVVEGLKNSAVASEFSEHGFFFANRKVTPLDKLPKGIDQGTGKTIEWKILSGNATRQLNMRVPGPEISAWEIAASRSGVDRNTWIRQTLNQAAGLTSAKP